MADILSADSMTMHFKINQDRFLYACTMVKKRKRRMIDN